MASDPTGRFAELVARADTDIPLDEAAVLIGAHTTPDLDVAATLGRLDDLAGACPEATFEGLCHHLFEGCGFRGDRDHYGDPRNSYLHEVIERRVGIPISLSVVAMEVGRRLGVPIVGIGMPGHFLARHQGDPPDFLDAFAGGARLDEAGCEALFRAMGGVAWQPEFLDPVGPRVILTRMLTNLQNLFLPKDLRSATWVLRLRLAVPGLPTGARVALARTLGSLGQFDVAGGELERLAELLPPDQAPGLRAEARALRARVN